MELEGCPGETRVFMFVGPLSGRGRPIPVCEHCYRVLTHDLERWKKPPEKRVLVASVRTRQQRRKDIQENDPRLGKLL